MKSETDTTLSAIFDILAEVHTCHGPTTKTFEFLERVCREAFTASRRGSDANVFYETGKFGRIRWPFLHMGSVSSTDIFSSLNELIIFTFYYANRHRYHRIADIGANIGLHTVLMSSLGWKVKAYEPDPKHIVHLKRNMNLNKFRIDEIHEIAVSDKSGSSEFVRVLDNTTSSHIAGSKESPYGELKRIAVKTMDIRDIVPHVDFIKIDAEGHERILIECLSAEHFENLDMIVEVGSVKNACAIYDHLSSQGINTFSQKIGW
jgi:FkbM family methyltransferase